MRILLRRVARTFGFPREKWEKIDLIALESLRAFPGTYVPWGAWSMRPSAVAVAVNLIVMNDMAAAVELGCGASTLMIGRALRETGGRLVSFEQNADWAAAIAGRVAADGLSDTVTVQHAPLAPLPPVNRPGWPQHAPHEWYDTEIVERSAPDVIDLLLVDGPAPSGHRGELVRLPAIPLLEPRLADRCAVAIDDCTRRAEREIAGLWAKWLGTAPPVFTRTDLAVITRGDVMLTSL